MKTGVSCLSKDDGSFSCSCALSSQRVSISFHYQDTFFCFKVNWKSALLSKQHALYLLDISHLYLEAPEFLFQQVWASTKRKRLQLLSGIFSEWRVGCVPACCNLTSATKVNFPRTFNSVWEYPLSFISHFLCSLDYSKYSSHHHN